MEPVVEQLQKVRQLFEGKGYSEHVANDDDENGPDSSKESRSDQGILMRDMQDYISCITVQSEKLSEMLQEDQRAWESNLEQVRLNADLFKHQIDEAIKEQERKLAEILRPKRKVYARPANPFSLLKLNLFGEQVHSRSI